MVKIDIKILVHFERLYRYIWTLMNLFLNKFSNFLFFLKEVGINIGKEYYLEIKRNKNFPNVIRRVKKKNRNLTKGKPLLTIETYQKIQPNLSYVKSQQKLKSLLLSQ